jgi:hypothetical protein
MKAQNSGRPLTEIDQWIIRAFLARVTADPVGERDALQKLRALQPHRKEHLYQLAESYFITADIDDAIADYQMTIALDDKFGAAYNHMGFAYSWKGDYGLSEIVEAQRIANNLQDPAR